MRVSPVEPMGWCSWYCYGLDIDKDILARTMTDIRQKAPELKIVQIDDGYEKHMGDWLDESDKLGAPASALCRDMADGGFIPASGPPPSRRKRTAACSGSTRTGSYRTRTAGR